MFGYITEKSSGHIISYFDLTELPEETDKYTFTECLESEKPELYKPKLYKSEELLLDAFQNVLTQEPIASLNDGLKAQVINYTTRFADNANNDGAQLYRTVAQAMGLSVQAEIVINKAIELGANIQGGE